MIATNIITEERFREFLSKTIINKEYAKKLMLLFYGINDIEIQSKLMFLAYNEYKCIDDVLDLIRSGKFDFSVLTDVFAAYNAVKECIAGPKVTSFQQITKQESCEISCKRVGEDERKCTKTCKPRAKKTTN